MNITGNLSLKKEAWWNPHGSPLWKARDKLCRAALQGLPTSFMTQTQGARITDLSGIPVFLISAYASYHT